VDYQVHKFVVDNQDHPQMIEICAQLKRLSGFNVCDMGCVQYTKFVLHNVEEEESVFHLCHYSKKLAIAMGSSTQLLVLQSE
jgi:hypothetical protein